MTAQYRATAPVIELSDVRKVYSTGSLEVEALRGVSVSIDEGEYVAIMGPSGSGKSTLMHILGCLDVPTSGSYLLAGDDVSCMSEAELAEVRNRRIGFVFQQFNLLPSLAAWRNVELPLCYAGVPRPQRRERALAALDRVGLADRALHRPGELSGGQQQRVAVARALVTDPALILADEPTGNLDSRSTADVLGLFEELRDVGRTIVMITHERDVAAHAARTVLIRDGQIQDDGSGAPSPLAEPPLVAPLNVVRPGAPPGDAADELEGPQEGGVGADDALDDDAVDDTLVEGSAAEDTVPLDRTSPGVALDDTQPLRRVPGAGSEGRE